MKEFRAGADPDKADTDGDGFQDGAEVLAGSDPARIDSVPSGDLGIYAAVEIEYATQAGGRYQIEFSTDLQTWNNFGEPFTGDGQIMRWFATLREHQRQFFRIKRL